LGWKASIIQSAYRRFSKANEDVNLSKVLIFIEIQYLAEYTYYNSASLALMVPIVVIYRGNMSNQESRDHGMSSRDAKIAQQDEREWKCEIRR